MRDVFIAYLTTHTMTIIKTLFRLGTSQALRYEHAKKVEFTNQITVLYFCISIIYSFIFMAIKAYILMLILISASLIYAFSLYLNHKKKFDISRYIIISNTTVAIYLATAITGKSVAGHVFLIFLFPLSLMLFSSLKNNILSLMFPFIAYVSLEWTDYYFFYQVTLSNGLTRFLSISVFIITSIILCLMIFFYKGLVGHMATNASQIFALYPLTERELDVLSEITKGKTNKKISDYLFIEESTVKTHLKNIFRKLKVSTRAEIFALMMQNITQA